MWDLVHDVDATEDGDRPAAASSSAVAAEDKFPKRVQPAALPQELIPAPAPKPAAPVEVPRAATPAPAARAEAPAEKPEDDAVSRQQRRSGRVKTRLLGFEHSSGKTVDVFEKAAEAHQPEVEVRFPVGWLVVVEGPGLGAAVPLLTGVSQIGRDEDQAVQLDYGDTSISRANHAAIAFDEEERAFYIGHGGKSNLVRLNGKPLLSTEQVKHGDTVKIGETSLRLVALCGESFSWAGLNDPKNAQT
jgi:hypothetical protein